MQLKQTLRAACRVSDVFSVTATSHSAPCLTGMKRVLFGVRRQTKLSQIRDAANLEEDALGSDGTSLLGHSAYPTRRDGVPKQHCFSV